MTLTCSFTFNIHIWMSKWFISGNSQIRRHVDTLDAVSDTGSCSSGQSEEDSVSLSLEIYFLRFSFLLYDLLKCC